MDHRIPNWVGVAQRSHDLLGDGVGLKPGAVWNWTPGRSVKVKLLASGDTSQRSARRPTSLVPGRSKASKPSKILRVAVLVPLLSHRPGSKPSGLASAQ
jgi:hypothetical protein